MALILLQAPKSELFVTLSAFTPDPQLLDTLSFFYDRPDWTMIRD